MRSRTAAAAVAVCLALPWWAGTAQAATVRTVVDATHPLTLTYQAPAAGEGLLHLTVDAPGADWSAATGQGGMLEVDVDGVKDTDLDVFTTTPTDREVGLGTLTAGLHTVTVLLGPSSPLPAVGVAAPVVSQPTDPALAYAPVVYGRTLAAYGPATQNTYDDAPVLGWHETTTPEPGVAEYDFSEIWTNEDNGTGSPDLMGRWGRTTDIELSYTVQVQTTTGRILQETFQGPNHVTTAFKGRKEGLHPLLQVCTGNNNFCDDATAPEGSTTPATVGGPLRYVLAYDETRDPARARESLMDAHPWVYGVMAAEQRREGKVTTATCEPGATAATDTVHVCDQRRYLYLEVVKSTGLPKDPTGQFQPIGISLAVVLRDGRTFTSDRGVTGRTAVRDVPVTESVDLPPGTRPSDVYQVLAVRQDTSPQYPDPMSPVSVTALQKGFFLDDAYLPQASFVPAGGAFTARTLTPAAPSAVIWQASDPAAALPDAPLAALLLGLGLVAAGTVAVRRRVS